MQVLQVACGSPNNARRRRNSGYSHRAEERVSYQMQDIAATKSLSHTATIQIQKKAFLLPVSHMRHLSVHVD
jgi:hypothetical protein